MPLIARATFRRELQAETVACFGAALLVPSLLQAFAKQDLGAPDVLLPLYFVGSIAGNLLASVVTQVFQRRRRVPYVVAARLGMGGALGVLAILPAERGTLLPFTAILLTASILGQILLSIASSLWHTNYPQALRGSIWSRLTVFKLLATAVGVQLAGVALDAWPWAHHLVFGIGGGCFCISGGLYSRIRVRREKKLLAQAHHDREPVRLLGGLRVLREDRHFLRYMVLQFTGGSMNLIIIGGMLYLAMDDVFHVDYKQVAGAFVFIPALVQVVALPVAGAAFDRMPIMAYRAIAMVINGVQYGMIFLGLAMQSWAVVLTGFTLRGVAIAAGGVAWNIGHTRFVPAHRSQLYMGVHMTLTGLRGLSMPFLGVLLYRGIDWPALGLHWEGLGLATLGLGSGVLFLTAALFALTPSPPALDED